MVKRKTPALALLTCTGLLLFAGYATNGSKQLNNVANASVVEVAQANTASARFFKDNQGLAIRGTDTVAYFKQGAPVAGNAEFSHDWAGATWLFATAENREARNDVKPWIIDLKVAVI